MATTLAIILPFITLAAALIERRLEQDESKRRWLLNGLIGLLVLSSLASALLALFQASDSRKNESILTKVERQNAIIARQQRTIEDQQAELANARVRLETFDEYLLEAFLTDQVEAVEPEERISCCNTVAYKTGHLNKDSHLDIVAAFSYGIGTGLNYGCGIAVWLGNEEGFRFAGWDGTGSRYGAKPTEFDIASGTITIYQESSLLEEGGTIVCKVTSEVVCDANAEED